MAMTYVDCDIAARLASSEVPPLAAPMSEVFVVGTPAVSAMCHHIWLKEPAHERHGKKLLRGRAADDMPVQHCSRCRHRRPGNPQRGRRRRRRHPLRETPGLAVMRQLSERPPRYETPPVRTCSHVRTQRDGPFSSERRCLHQHWLSRCGGDWHAHPCIDALPPSSITQSNYHLGAPPVQESPHQMTSTASTITHTNECSVLMHLTLAEMQRCQPRLRSPLLLG